MYDLAAYLAMMRDPVRVPAYERAIRAAVRPGDTVLDLGCGPGLLTFMALDAGAARVFAVDKNPAVEILRLIAKENRLADRLTVVCGDARAVDFPATDVVVHDVRGVLPVLGGGVALVAGAARRLKPGGRLVPQADEIVFAPIDRADLHQRVAGWRARMAGAAWDAVAPFATGAHHRTILAPGDLLAEGKPLPPIDYAAPAASLTARHEFVVTRAGACDAVGAWFRTRLTPDVGFDLAPGGPETVYGHACFPLLERHAVLSGDRVTIELGVHDVVKQPLWRWTVEVERDGRRLAHERRSSLDGALFPRESVAARRADAVLAPTEELQVAREILNAIDGATANEAIARRLSERFPARFPRWQDALGRIAAVVTSGGGAR